MMNQRMTFMSEIDDIMMHKTYLGDGVYATFDGYAIILDLRGQDNTTRIYLEPAVMKSLHKFAESVKVLRDEFEYTQTIELSSEMVSRILSEAVAKALDLSSYSDIKVYFDTQVAHGQFDQPLPGYVFKQARVEIKGKGKV